MSIEQEIRQFIRENFILDEASHALAGDDSLTQTGVIDSMGVLEIVTFIESKYGFKVPDQDTVPENLDSINNLVRYVQTRQQAVPAA